MKVFKALVDLDASEMQSFKDFIIFKHGADAPTYLFAHYADVMKHQNGDVNRALMKNQHFSTLSQKAFLNLASKTYLIYEEWLIYTTCLEDDHLKNVLLLKALNRRGQYELANKHYEKVERILNKEERVSLDHSQTKHMMRYYHYYSDNPIKYKKKGSLLNDMIQHYLLQLKESCILYLTELENWQSKVAFDFSESRSMLIHVINLLPEGHLSSQLQALLKLTSKQDVSSFLFLKKNLDQGIIKVNSELYYLTYFYLLQYSQSLWVENKIQDLQLIFELYESAIEKGIFLQKGVISKNRFLNIVAVVSLILKGKEKYLLVDQMAAYTNASEREDLRKIGYIQCMINDQRFEEILPLARTVNPTPHLQGLRLQSFELIALYELRAEYYPVLKNKLYNYKRTIKNLNKSKIKSDIQLHLNFLLGVEDLVKAETKNKVLQIENYLPTANKYWLQTKIEALHSR